MTPHIEILARALLLRGQHVLLCQNTKHGYFYLPGGHVEFGEPAAVALARELKEEAGLDVTVGRCLLAAETSFNAKHPHHELNLVFHVEHPPTEVKSLEDGIAFVWADLAAIVDLDVRPGCIKAWLVAGGMGQTAADAAVEWISDIRPAGE